MTSPPRRFANTHPDVVIGNFPWYEMVWRSLRGDFKPRSNRRVATRLLPVSGRSPWTQPAWRSASRHP